MDQQALPIWENVMMLNNDDLWCMHIVLFLSAPMSEISVAGASCTSISLYGAVSFSYTATLRSKFTVYNQCWMTVTKKKWNGTNIDIRNDKTYLEYMIHPWAVKYFIFYLYITNEISQNIQNIQVKRLHWIICSAYRVLYHSQMKAKATRKQT